MTAFDEAWDFAKDFYFDPENSRLNEKELTGGMKSFKSVLGSYERPLVNARRKNHDPSSRYLLPKNFKPGKHIPVVLPRTHTMEYAPDLGTAPVSVDNYTLAGPEGLNHYLGVNLSAVNMPGRTEEQMIDEIINALVHEHGHAAIDNDLTREYYEKALKAKNYRDAEKAYHQYVGAHEFGAYNLQNPGGSSAEAMARFNTVLHPNWKLANSFKVPKAHINSRQT